MQCFSRRYANYPVIFVGTLVEALRDAFKAQKLEEVNRNSSFST